VSTYQTYITLIKKDKISAAEVPMNIDSIVNNLESRKSGNDYNRINNVARRLEGRRFSRVLQPMETEMGQVHCI
jgi:hypothetical protein